MAFDISIAGVSIPTHLAELKSFPKDLNLAFQLDQALAPWLDKPLGNIPVNATRTAVSYTSPKASWAPAGGPITFGLSGAASGLFDIIPGGELLSYIDGLETQTGRTISIPQGFAYARLTLLFSISARASGSGNFSGGAFGVKGSAGSDEMFQVAFFKRFDPAVTVAEAVAKTFCGFVLPLHVDTIKLLDDGDYLQHDFDGNLDLSFGIFTGVDKVLYSGQACTDVLNVRGTPLATLSVGAKPEVHADAQLDISFEYATRYQCLLSKLGPVGTLHVFRSSTAHETASVAATVGFNGNAAASVETNTQKLADSLARATGPGAEAVSHIASSASQELTKAVAAVNGKLADWLGKADGKKASLQASIESIQGRTLLANYRFDLSEPGSPGLEAAWKLAIEGDLAGALRYRDPVSGKQLVVLDAGSGLEKEYRWKSSFSCNFFNLAKFNTWTEWQKDVSLIYAGNNIFHLSAKIGRVTETATVGAMKSINFYFAADADQLIDSSIDHLAIDLHMDLAAKNDAKAAQQIAAILQGIGDARASAVAAQMKAYIDSSPIQTIQLNVTLPARAYGKITADPASGAETTAALHDRRNWQAYSDAADELKAWPLRDLALRLSPPLGSYESWALLNKSFNNGADYIEGAVPDRTHRGDSAQWPHAYASVADSNKRTMISYSIWSGQQFMNLCAALAQLGSAVATEDPQTSWDNLVKLLTDATKNYVPDFARPTAMAILKLCATEVQSVQGPISNDVTAGPFEVKINF